MFNTNPGCKKLSKEQGQLFHHLVAKLLYLSKCTRQDIQTVALFELSLPLIVDPIAAKV